MHQEFSVDSEGWLSECSVQELANWYHSHVGRVSELTFEAHLMVMRVAASLTPGSPLDPSVGLSRARYNILRLLYQAKNRRLLMGDFAEWMNVSPTNITKLIDTLVADGLVQRVTHEIDKRKTWAELTDAGAEMVERAIPDVGAHVESLWDGLEDEEKKVLVHLLAKMHMNLLQADRDRPAEAIRALMAG
jgi:DNA-binding MarR family transcriptional regulator